MIETDIKKIRDYVRFQEAYKLDRKLGKIFDFEFGNVDYWMVANQYIDFIFREKPIMTNNIFSFYYNKLHPEIKDILYQSYTTNNYTPE